MKTIFTITFLLSATLLIAQTSFKTGITTPSHYNGIIKTVQLNDGSYVGVGIDNFSSDTSSHIMLVKLSAQGSLLSSKIISSSGDDEGISIIKTSDGGFAVSGFLSDEMGLLKFDANLALQWQKQYDTTDESDGTRLVQTSDGGFMIVGDIYDTEGNSAGYLVKTDNNGNVMFSKQYLGFNDNQILDISATKDGNYALLASADNFNEDSNVENDTAYVIKIKPDGSVIWASYINTGTNDQTPFSLLAASDGGFVVAGSVSLPAVFLGDSTKASQMLMSKFNASGTLLWSKTIASSNLNESTGFSVAEDNSGNYLFGGNAYFFEVDTSILNFTFSASSYLVKLSSGGSLVSIKTIDSNLTKNNFLYGLYSITNTSDGGFITSGFTYTGDSINYGTYGSIYKFNSNGDICGSSGSSGSITNTGTGVSVNIVNNSLSTVAANIAVTVTSAGTGVNICNLLPLRILSFNATLQSKAVNIEWKTTNEVNTDYFTVERSNNNTTSFTALQKVTAKGNSSSVQSYATSDLQPMFGTSYYRLKEIDKDGAITYSNIVPVTVSANGTIVISPNPVRDNIRVLLQSKENSSLSFQVADMSGRTLVMQSTKVNAGTSTIIIPASSLSKGLYVLKVIQNNMTQSIKFVKE